MDDTRSPLLFDTCKCKKNLLLLSTGQQGVRLQVVPHFSSGIMSRASETRARVKITPRERVLPFLAWGDFHARSRFARSTTRSLLVV